MSDISSEEEIVEKWVAVNRAQVGFRTSVGVGELTEALADFRKGMIESLQYECKRLTIVVSDERASKLQNTLQEMQKPVCRIANQTDYIYSSMESTFEPFLTMKRDADFELASEKNRIIKWISSLGKDYEKNHSSKARYRLADSGQWLLRTQKYRHWLNSSSCSVLWLHGGGRCSLHVFGFLKN
jgi:hypothetical protein